MTEGSFRELELRVAYGPGDDPLHSFYLPTLSLAVHYDRSAAYFSSGALVVAAQGLARLIANGGTMRLLAGAQLSPKDVEAVRQGATIEEVARDRLVALLEEPEDELARRRLEALAWMVATGALQMKVVLRRGPDGLPMAEEGDEAYYHPKKGLFTDAAGDRVGFSGSINESINAWRRHFEEFHVFRSWEPGERPHLSQVEAYFSRVWENEDPDWISIPVPEAVREGLLRFCPDEAPERDPLEAPGPPSPPPSAPPEEDAIVAWFLRDVPYLLDVGSRVGRATAAIDPWPHQLRVASGVVERFPERFLLADEVGLGKTIEAGLILRDLLVTGEVERCLILAPASVLRQWQDELREKFALEVPIYDGGRLIGPGPDHMEQPISGQSPWSEVPVVLASSQLVKRKDRRAELLTGPDWDLVVLDEAHHARRKDFQDLSLRRPNRLLELLEGTDGLPGLASKTHGLLLLTATPMQVHAVEVWDLLMQLGLAGRWGASEASFLRYFEELRLAETAPQDADWRFLAAMARDELTHGGPVDPEIEQVFESRLGFAGWSRVRDFPYASDPEREARAMSDQDRAALLALLRHLTPLRRRMYRHTRDLLRRYRERGLLPGNIAEREPEPRWITFAPEEAELYRRVEEYISRFYQKYEGERKGLGFVMTVYRRRLTSSFSALQRSLERRLAFLQGQSHQLGLTDEDLEDLDLSEDVTEVLADEDRGRALASIHAEEIGYVEDFLRALRGLGSDTKFEQLTADLDRALSTRDSVVVFTQYADTVDHLKEKLRLVYGDQVACYTGRAVERWAGVGWAPSTKEEIKRAFRDGEVKILLGTDALAEGLNLQTCGVEINYDAPWNPMRLEQRIGRIDRIGQRHDTVWVWTYFYEDTVEAQVYSRLATRIDWFKGVVGPLQPILHRVERTIRDLALEDPQERSARLEPMLRALEEEIDRARQEGFDLDAVLEERVEAPEPVSPPVSWEELERFLTRAPALASRFRRHPEIEGAYLVTVGGEEVAVTFDPTVSDEHPDSVRLLTFGDRVLEELLEALGKPHRPTGALVRVQLVDARRPLVAWYRPDASGVSRIDRLEDLRAALRADPGGEVQLDEVQALAEEDFAAAVTRRLEAEHQEALRRADERLSALRERARELLERATYVWAARQAGGGSQVTALGETTVQAMVLTEGYPFGPLGAKAAGMPSVGKDTPGWAEIEPKNAKQLEGLWQSLKNEAGRLVRRIVDAELARERIAAPPPDPVLEAQVV
jgi:superfamily II DNA or RNA helicase